MIKIKDIAKATGYSVTTVSKAFNDYKDISAEAKSKILSTAEEMGYVPNATARSLATKKSYTIGIIFDEMLGFGIRHPFFGAVIEYFKAAIEREGYDILFISTKIGNTHIKTYLDHCKQRDVDGIFIVYADFKDPKIIQVLESGIPTVTIETSHQPVHSVNSDDYEGLMSAVDYLYALGHKKIAHISGDFGTYSAQERRRGYLEGMSKHNLPVDKRYIVEGNLFTFEGGYKAMEALIELKNRPTAIAAAGDILALGAIKCAHDKGLHIPKDISIIGYDNIDMLGYMSPGLTTVAQNVEMMGRKAAELLIQNIIDPTMKKKEIVLATKIIERDSCKSI